MLKHSLGTGESRRNRTARVSQPQVCTDMVVHHGVREVPVEDQFPTQSVEKMPPQFRANLYTLTPIIHVTDWLTVRPNVQYIVHPGGTDHVDNALVAGIKLETKF
ncbi:carbohydrate porin [Pseudomonas sp. 17]|uniref:Carbohydrate porin n=1 Tax=Pseudomonas fragariae (ex Marin et al. 2024) TaxID=3080056 RepID=A0ABT3LNN9_9PSED|nr:carbohydrate porin [Pseudomonas fragi]